MYSDYDLTELSKALASESRRNETFQRVRQDQLDAREKERQWREKEEKDARLKRQQQQQQQQQQQLLQQQYDAWPGMSSSLASASPYDSYTADLPPVQQTRTRVPFAGPAHASRHPPPMPKKCKIGTRFCAMRECIRQELGINLPDRSTCKFGRVNNGKSGSVMYGREVCQIVINEKYVHPTDPTKLVNTIPAKINGTIAHKIVQWDVQYTHREEDPDVIQCICDLAASHFAGPDYVSDDRCDNYNAINASTTKRMRINLLLQNYPALPAPQF
jgi:hypothetical protein